MQPGLDNEGFFAGNIHQSSNALVLFVMITLVIVACIFTSGLLILLVTQAQNFCVGRTSIKVNMFGQPEGGDECCVEAAGGAGGG